VRRRRRSRIQSDVGPLIAGELEIRPDQFQAFVGGRSLELTRREFELLQLLAEGKGNVLEREAIYQRVWGYSMAHGDRSVDVFVRKLRQKLERGSPSWRYIHTHFGIGYRFDPETLVGDGKLGMAETSAPAVADDVAHAEEPPTPAGHRAEGRLSRTSANFYRRNTPPLGVAPTLDEMVERVIRQALRRVGTRADALGTCPVCGGSLKVPSGSNACLARQVRAQQLRLLPAPPQGFTTRSRLVYSGVTGRGHRPSMLLVRCTRTRAGPRGTGRAGWRSARMSMRPWLTGGH